jgi:hypothetical protein
MNYQESKLVIPKYIKQFIELKSNTQINRDKSPNIFKPRPSTTTSTKPTTKEEKIIYIPNDREESTTKQFPIPKDINFIRNDAIKNKFNEDTTRPLLLRTFAYDLHTPTPYDAIKYQEGYMRRILNNLKNYMNNFCFFKYKGKEKELYSMTWGLGDNPDFERYNEIDNADKYRSITMKRAVEKLQKAKKQRDQEKIDDAKYNIQQLTKSWENIREEYEASRAEPYKLADIQFNKLINVLSTQTIDNKKLYMYEILGLDKKEYDKMIELCKKLKKFRIDKDMAESSNTSKLQKTIFVKINTEVESWYKYILDILENKQIKYVIR